MKNVFSSSRRRLLAGMMAAGFVGPAAVAQNASSSSGELAPCQKMLKLTSGDHLFTRLYNGSVNQSAHIDATREKRAKEGGQYFLLFRDPGKDTATIQFRHPAMSRLINGHYRWVSLNKSHKHLAIKKSSRLFAPSFLVPAKDYLANEMWLQLWYPGSDLEGSPDEYFYFPWDAFREAIKHAPAQAEAIRTLARAARCDQTKSPGCFLTTAAVEMMGLPDDCWELEQLRSFRDNWLAHQPGGVEQILEYYERAPAIAEQLTRDPRRLSRLYVTDILPSAIAARFGFNASARTRYARMMHKLSDLG